VTQFSRPNHYKNTTNVPPYLWVSQINYRHDPIGANELIEVLKTYFPNSQITTQGKLIYHRGCIEIQIDTEADNAEFMVLASAGAFNK
jgi:hypothetical protein